MPAADCYRWDGADLLLEVRLQPRASRDGLSGVHDGRLRVRVTAPPLDGRANRRAQELLADAFGVARSAVVLIAGARARDKRFRIAAPGRLPEILADAV